MVLSTLKARPNGRAPDERPRGRESDEQSESDERSESFSEREASHRSEWAKGARSVMGESLASGRVPSE
jgi:hypothetical protein